MKLPFPSNLSISHDYKVPRSIAHELFRIYPTKRFNNRINKVYKPTGTHLGRIKDLSH
jgi:hypothetical protein